MMFTSLSIVAVLLCMKNIVSGQPTLVTPDFKYCENDLNLTCNQAGFNASLASWTKDASPVHNDAGDLTGTGRYSQTSTTNTFTLLISRAISDDGGVFVCNHGFASSNAVTLQLYCPPTDDGLSVTRNDQKKLVIDISHIYPNTATVTVTKDTISLPGTTGTPTANGDYFNIQWISIDKIDDELHAYKITVVTRTTSTVIDKEAIFGEPPEPPCNLIVCWIIVIVYLVTCIILLVIYCVMQWECESDSSSFIPTYILPACILTVIGIVVTVVVSRVAEKDCSIGACLVGPLIVSIIESWIPMIVICIHSKCCVPKKYCLCCGNWKDDKDKTKNKKLADQAVTTGNNGGSSCFGGNNSILPICTGTDQGPQQSLGGVQGDGGQYPAKGQKNKQKPDHGRQKPDGDNGKHLDHGKQHLDHGKLRPLPLAGGDDGLQQNNEALQFKPRKLPEIPAGGEKSIQGISANFDNPVPDKKRPTPIGKETIEKFDEESPRKKKKKKKKKDKGKDTSVEYDTDV